MIHEDNKFWSEVQRILIKDATSRMDTTLKYSENLLISDFLGVGSAIRFREFKNGWKNYKEEFSKCICSIEVLKVSNFKAMILSYLWILRL